MAGAQLAKGVGRFNRWVTTTPRALEATQLVVAVVLSLTVLGLVSLLADIGRWGLLLAALPLVIQGRALLERVKRPATDDSPDLPAGSLADIDLTGADLSCRDLRRRDLSDARLTRANLIGADLSGSSIAGAGLRRADLSYGSLEGADGVKASFDLCRLVETDLRSVDARRAGFERADLRGADLRGANLLGAAFRGADVRGAVFTGAKLAPDALSDAVLDTTTILADGSAADPGPVSLVARLVPSGGLLLGGALWSMARPAFHGLAWASLLTGAVVAVESSGGGLGDELAIMTRTEPVVVTGSGAGQVRRMPDRDASSERSTQGIPELDDTDDTSTSGDTALVPPPGTEGVEAEQPGERSGDDGASDGPGLGGRGADPVGGATGSGLREVGAGVGGDGIDGDPVLSEVGTVPNRAAAQADPDPADPVDESSAAESPTTTQPLPAPTDTSTSVPTELTEVDVPVTSALADLRQVRIVVGSEGGSSTVTSASSLGQLEPRSVTGADGWDLALPSGQVLVQVTPADATVSTACQILVDGAERSFQSGLDGQTSTCIVDLDPVG